MSDKNIYLPLVEKFFEYDMEAASRIFESLPDEEVAAVFQSLPPALAARVIKHLQISFAASLLKDSDDPFMHQIVSNLNPQFAASILMHLPADDRERMTRQVTGKLRDQIREALDYPEGSVGRIMTTDFLSFDKTMLAQEAIEKIRLLAKKRYPLSYAYVTDAENRLVGVLNMRDLMIASPDKSLADIIHAEVFSVHCFTDLQEVANELSRRKYFAVPVVDSENHMLGIIKAERLIQGVQEDVTKDIQRMFGAGSDERVFSTLFFSLKKRLPWLYVNLATAFLAAAVVAMFEGIIAKLTVLAVFLPVVAGQGGNAGAQSLAVVMRGIVMREIPKDKISGLIFKEGKLGAINGALVGVVTALVAWLWNGNPYLGVVIGLGMLFNLIFAGLSGASIPLLMKRIGLDPAQSSSIILTTVTDVMGFIAFLGFAVLFQSFLV